MILIIKSLVIKINDFLVPPLLFRSFSQLNITSEFLLYPFPLRSGGDEEERSDDEEL